MRRTEDIGKDLRDQLLADLCKAPCCSIAVDESTDVTDVAQLCVWVVPTTTSWPNKRGYSECTFGKALSWSKLASVCTDGAPSM